MQTYVVDHRMDRRSYRDFKEEFDNGILENFIKKYNQINNCNLAPEIIMSLGLYEAIRRKDVRLIDKILSTTFITTILLTTVNDEAHSPLTTVLAFNRGIVKDETLKVIRNHITKIDKSTKVDLRGPDLVNLRRIALTIQVFEDCGVNDNIKYLEKHYLKYVYTTKSIDDFKNSFSYKSGFNEKKYLEETKVNNINYSNSVNPTSP